MSDELHLRPVLDGWSGAMHLAEPVDKRRRRDRRRHPKPAATWKVICGNATGELQPAPEPKRGRPLRRKLRWCERCEAYATAAGIELPR